MEKQKVKIGMEHFKIDLSGMKCLIVFYILKNDHCRPKQHHRHQTNLNFAKNNCLKRLNQK